MNVSEKDSMICCSEITLTLGRQAVFNRLNIDFSANGISFLVGANGVGKTQLLRLIHGLIQPDSGQLTAPPIKQQAFLSQSPILLKRTVKENLLFIRGCSVAPVIHFDTNFEEVIKYFQLTKLLSQQVMTLSGGQKKRVAIARLFLQQASCYLIDEPSANVDYQTNVKIEAAIEQLVRADNKVIVASHDLVQIERLFDPKRDELLLLHPSQIQGQLISRYCSLDFNEIKKYL